MTTRSQIALKAAIILIGGAFLSFVQLTNTDSLTVALAIGYFYMLIVSVVFLFVHRVIASKLSVFPGGQQLILKSLVYAVAISFAYLTGFIFQTVLLLPIDKLKESVLANAWKGFVYIIASPFTAESSANILTAELRTILISFFAMFFLIGVVSIVGSLVEIRWREARQKQAFERAELSALRAQIEPHFLFNSLNTIASLIKTDADKAEQLIVQLSDILRYLQGPGGDMTELQNELKFTEKYVSILEARFEDRLDINWNIEPGCLTQKVPVFLIQPLIENAIRHGWRKEESPLAIRISAIHDSESIEITVSDNGTGIRPDILNDLPRNGHALANIAERLALFFKKKDLLRVESETGKGTKIAITIPSQPTAPAHHGENE